MPTAHRYYVRSPRYILQTGDQRLLRFAGMETRGESHVTRVLNLSESGLAFEVQPDKAPSEGDVLKVEFDVPNHLSHHSKVACFATVVRVEPKEPSQNHSGDASDWHPLSGLADDLGHSAQAVIHLVGLQFRNLPSAYRRLLAQSLKDRVHNDVIIDWKSFRRRQLASFAGLSLATLAVLFLLATPCQSWLDTLKALF